MNALRNSLSVGLLTTLAAITIPVSSAEAQVTIIRVNGGGSAPAAAGSGNLTNVFNAACDWWEAALVSPPYTLTLTYQWGPRSGGTLASHSLTAQGGTPNRETAGTITFDNDGSTSWYIDGSPCNNSEFGSYTQGTGNYGGGSLIDQANFATASGGASGNFDLFTVVLHEVGHSLGLSSANTSFQAERVDNDVDVTSPRPFAGSALPLNSSTAHLAINTSLMWPFANTSRRGFPTEADLLANAQISSMTGIGFLSNCPTAGCARYIPDSNPSTGTVNVIPFGASSSASSTLTSVFASNNGGNTGGAVYFDLTTFNSNVYLGGLDVNTSVTSGTDIEADIYYIYNGTYSGNETSPGAWTTWTAAKGTSAGLDQPSTIIFNRPLQIAAGDTVALAVVARNFNHSYTNGANSYSNSALQLDLGSATNVPFTANVFSPRTANVTARYQVDAVSFLNCRYQQVLRSSDLGASGMITGLAFAPSATARHYNRTLRIRMAHKPAGYNLSTSFGTNITGATTVLSESWYSWFTQGDSWSEVGLETPFNYNGTSDVVVEILAIGNIALEGSTGGFHRGTEERLSDFSFAWNSTPTTGALGNAGTKMRAEFSCGEGGEFGTACGPIRASHTGNGTPGTTFRYVMTGGVPSSGAVAQLGFSNTRQSLNSFGFTNCVAWNDNAAAVFKLTNILGGANHPIALPNTAVFNGLKIYGHWYNFDSSAPGGVTASNYTRLIIGEAP